jgi:sialic acid synthase SpsE
MCKDERVALNDDGLAEMVETLRSVSESLADRSLAILKEANRAGETKRPDEERVVSQARRAVEKAISLLSRGH